MTNGYNNTCTCRVPNPLQNCLFLFLHYKAKCHAYDQLYSQSIAICVLCAYTCNLLRLHAEFKRKQFILTCTQFTLIIWFAMFKVYTKDIHKGGTWVPYALHVLDNLDLYF